MTNNTPVTVIGETPFDEEEMKSSTKEIAMSAVGAGAITLVVAAGSIFVAAGFLKLITFVLGGIASILTTIAPWAAVILGICAFSAFSK